PTFSTGQIQQLLAVIDTPSAQGYRDYVIILTFLDTGLRVSELIGLQLPNVSLDEAQLKVLGKGNKERLIPVGRKVCQYLVRYISRYRPSPTRLKEDRLFLSWDGFPLTKDRMGSILRGYGQKAHIEGVRCSPHTLRHTAAVSYLRQGGDPFTLQRLLGHSTLDMTRRYCELADLDLQRVHQMASPVDNIDVKMPSRPFRPSRG
ncbi:MAG: tyrosine-type recombinase/integrase, partial [Chloroflexi bacterium]|nr:tyrosine-type recombinase/integrase [Chloroflexota bacterium]